MEREGDYTISVYYLSNNDEKELSMSKLYMNPKRVEVVKLDTR